MFGNTIYNSYTRENVNGAYTDFNYVARCGWGTPSNTLQSAGGLETSFSWSGGTLSVSFVGGGNTPKVYYIYLSNTEPFTASDSSGDNGVYFNNNGRHFVLFAYSVANSTVNASITTDISAINNVLVTCVRSV